MDEIGMVEADLDPGAETVVLSYGITARAVREAVRRRRAAGCAVSSLTIHSLWPVPEGAIRAGLEGAKRVVIPELNLGQYRLEIERLVRDDVEVRGVNRVDGELITPDEILEEVAA